MSQFGITGQGNGEFDNLSGIASTTTHLFVADTGNNRIQVFDFNGNYVTQFDAGIKSFDPYGIAVNSTHIFASSFSNHLVYIIKHNLSEPSTGTMPYAPVITSYPLSNALFSPSFRTSFDLSQINILFNTPITGTINFDSSLEPGIIAQYYNPSSTIDDISSYDNQTITFVSGGVNISLIPNSTVTCPCKFLFVYNLTDFDFPASALNALQYTQSGWMPLSVVSHNFDDRLIIANVDSLSQFALGVIGNGMTNQSLSISVPMLNDLYPALANFTLNVSVTDAGVSDLTYSLDAISIGKGISIDSDSGDISWLPPLSQIGTHTITVIASAGQLVNSVTFDLVIGPTTQVSLFCGLPKSAYPSIIYGTNTTDILFGTNSNDLILAMNGGDYVRAKAGNDCIMGGLGNDYIDGGQGDDTIYGGIGDDFVRTGAGNDSVFGGMGDDIILGSSRGDIVNGEMGHDLCIGGIAQNCEVTSK